VPSLYLALGRGAVTEEDFEDLQQGELHEQQPHGLAPAQAGSGH
jgi:hypothetical protein